MSSTRTTGRSPGLSNRGRKTREKVLRSAEVVFGRRGFTDTTIFSIARHAGIASGTAYQYFDDKSDIFRCLLTDLDDRLRRESRLPADAEGHLVVRESMLTYFKICREHSSLFRVWWELLSPPTEFTEQWKTLHQRSRDEMIEMIKRGKRNDMIEKSVDAEITADLITAAWERRPLSHIVLGWDEDVSDEEVADVMAQLLGQGLSND